MTSTLSNGLLDRDRTAERWREFQKTKLYDALAASPLILLFGMSGAHLATELWSNLQQANAVPLDAAMAISLLRQAIAIILVMLLMTFLIMRNPAKAKAKGLMPRLAA